MNHTIDSAEKVNARAALIACGLGDSTTALGRTARSKLFDKCLIGEIWSFVEPKKIYCDDIIASIATDGEYIYAIVGRELNKRICKIRSSSGQILKEVTHVGFRPLHLATALVWQEGKLYMMAYSDYCVSILNTNLELVDTIFVADSLQPGNIAEAGDINITDITIYDGKMYMINGILEVMSHTMGPYDLPRPMIEWGLLISRIIADENVLWISKNKKLSRYDKDHGFTDVKLTGIDAFNGIYAIANANDYLLAESITHETFLRISKEDYKLYGSIKFILNDVGKKLWVNRGPHEMCAHENTVCIISPNKSYIYVFIQPFV